MQEQKPKITHRVYTLLQMGSVCGPVLRGPPGGGV